MKLEEWPYVPVHEKHLSKTTKDGLDTPVQAVFGWSFGGIGGIGSFTCALSLKYSLIRPIAVFQ